MCGIFKESGLSFDFGMAKNAKKADERNVQGLSLVDFIIETDTEYVFIEVKNPDDPRASEEQRRKYLNDLTLDVYYLKMAAKFKDSLLREVVMGKCFEKPVTYIVILQFSLFDMNQRMVLFNKIREQIPLFKESEYKAVSRAAFAGVMNIHDFNKKYPQFPCSIVS